MNQIAKTEAASTVRCLDKEPYHYTLMNAVQQMMEAHVLGYPMDYNWIERERDNLSHILDKMDGKS